jgi:hypothetical protein
MPIKHSPQRHPPNRRFLLQPVISAITPAEPIVTAIVATSSPAGNGTPVLSLQPQKATGTVRTATKASIFRTESRMRGSLMPGKTPDPIRSRCWQLALLVDRFYDSAAQTREWKGLSLVHPLHLGPSSRARLSGSSIFRQHVTTGALEWHIISAVPFNRPSGTLRTRRAPDPIRNQGL